MSTSIYMTVDTLKYFEKGRQDLTCSGSNRNSAEFETGASDPGRKTRWICGSGWKQGEQKTMLDAMEKDMLHRFQNQKIHLGSEKEEAIKWKEEIEERSPWFIRPVAERGMPYWSRGRGFACSKVI